MQDQVHIAIQIVPISSEHQPYAIIDKAIDVIAKSGVDYRVGAMETVMQGEYDTLMRVVKEAQSACLQAGAEAVVVNVKIHAKRRGPVTWEEKKV